MPEKLFYELSKEKKERIIAVGISEFAAHGYTNSSTNRIVKSSGISKGSLFKYFRNKEDLYFYILDVVTSRLQTDLGKKTEKLSKDLFQRVIQYSESEFAWYIQNPEEYKLILAAFTRNDTEIYQKTAARYHQPGQDIFYQLLEGIDTKQLKWEKSKIIAVLKWFLAGFNQDFITGIESGTGLGITKIREEYVKTLNAYLEILKEGFMQKEAD